MTGRGTIAMWGYPLWQFLGLWIVLMAPAMLRERFARVVTVWAIVFFGFAAAFFVSYAVMPQFDGRYRAVFFPGDRLGAELSARFRALTGNRLAYVIGTMWTGGNVAHYAPEHPRVVIDGNPSRAPWIDLGDLNARGASSCGCGPTSDPRVLPVRLPQPGCRTRRFKSRSRCPIARARAKCRSAGRYCGRARRWRASIQR